MELQSLGNMVRARREELGMTQAELGEKIGASAAYVSQIESGRRKRPRRYMAALAAALDVPEVRLETASHRRHLASGLMDLGAGLENLLPHVASELTERDARALVALVEATRNARGFQGVAPKPITPARQPAQLSENAIRTVLSAAESVGSVLDTVLPNWEALDPVMSAVVLSSFMRVTLVEGASIEVPVAKS